MSAAHLSRAGVSLVLGRDADGIPSVLHWGAALGDLDDDALDALAAARRPGVARSSYDVPRTTGLVPDGTRGFAGTPARLRWSGPRADWVMGLVVARRPGRAVAVGVDEDQLTHVVG